MQYQEHMEANKQLNQDIKYNKEYLKDIPNEIYFSSFKGCAPMIRNGMSLQIVNLWDISS